MRRRQLRASKIAFGLYFTNVSSQFQKITMFQFSNSRWIGPRPLFHASTMNHCYHRGDDYFLALNNCGDTEYTPQFKCLKSSSRKTFCIREHLHV